MSIVTLCYPNSLLVVKVRALAVRQLAAVIVVCYQYILLNGPLWRISSAHTGEIESVPRFLYEVLHEPTSAVIVYEFFGSKFHFGHYECVHVCHLVHWFSTLQTTRRGYLHFPA